MSLDTNEKTLIEARIANEGPSVVVAYLLWFFLWLFSAHRFYLGRTGSAITQLILNFMVIGLIWTLIDVFLIPGMVRQRQAQMRYELGQSMMMRDKP
jgi:TM2 domain-containing membrane protein YozV